MNVATYDFGTAPITFDFCNFLATARLAIARDTGSPEFWLKLDACSWRNETPRELGYTLEDRLWRLHNLIMPIISTAPGVAGVTLAQLARPRSDAKPDYEFRVEPWNYLTLGLCDIFASFPYDPHLFLAPQNATEYASKLLKVSDGKPTAIVSARNSSFQPERDSPAQTIQDVQRELIESGFCVFVIPDQEAVARDIFKGDSCFLVREASFNLPLRLALCELADVCIFPSSGPATYVSLAIQKPNMVIYSPLHPDVPTATPEWHEKNGLDVGARHPYPWTPENQIWLWDIAPSSGSILDAALSLRSP